MRGLVRNSVLTGLLAAVALLAPGTSADAAYGLGLVHGILEDYHQGGFGHHHGQGCIRDYCQGAFGTVGAYGGQDVGYYPLGPAGPAYGGCAMPIYGGNPVQNPVMGHHHGLFPGASGGYGMGGGFR
ncbi:MAG TPA: hypothetical protein VFT74_15640 [Isosphaeraceae bacterium]|nr:hypothetical protein [Isosphaeraceae bacterium]